MNDILNSLSGIFSHDSGNKLSVWSLILDAGVVVQAVLLLLLLLSFLSWAIVFNKWLAFRAAKYADMKFAELFWSGEGMQETAAQVDALRGSPLAAVYRQGYGEYVRLHEGDKQGEVTLLALEPSMFRIRHAIESEWEGQMDKYGSHLSFLATVGSTAPFIGLFGTVWGIIDAFQNIGITQNTSLATVAPGIAEALVATAFGLLAAIPAVIAYNAFSGRMKTLNSSLDGFATDLVHMISDQAKK